MIQFWLLAISEANAGVSFEAVAKVLVGTKSEAANEEENFGLHTRASRPEKIRSSAKESWKKEEASSLSSSLEVEVGETWNPTSH